jgi:CheY-like chemotaxis protein
VTEILLSHAAADETLASLLAEFLHLAVGVPTALLCRTNAPDFGTPVAQDFDAPFLSRPEMSKLSLALITESYLKSHFCLAELGALLAKSELAFLIVVPPVDAVTVNRTLGLAPAWKIDDVAGLDRLGTTIRNLDLRLEDRDSGEWELGLSRWQSGLDEYFHTRPKTPSAFYPTNGKVVAELRAAHAHFDDVIGRAKRLEALGAGRTVLIVEPEPLAALEYQDVVEAAGLHVVGIVQDAVAALKLIEEHKPAVVVTETILRNNSSGFDVARKAAERGSHIVFITPDVKRLADAGLPVAAAFMQKPVNSKALVDVIEYALTGFTANRPESFVDLGSDKDGP